jgi:hypothetical protein
VLRLLLAKQQKRKRIFQSVAVTKQAPVVKRVASNHTSGRL